MAVLDEQMTHRRCDVAFPCPRLSDGNHIHGLLHKRAVLQPLNLLREHRPESAQVELRQGLLAWQARFAEQPLKAALLPVGRLLLHKCIEKRRVGEAFLGCPQRQGVHLSGRMVQLDAVQQACQILMTIRHRHSSW